MPLVKSLVKGNLISRGQFSFWMKVAENFKTLFGEKLLFALEAASYNKSLI